MYISVKHDSIASYWETPQDFFTCELGAYVNDYGEIVIPTPYYAKDKNDWISTVSYNMNEFTKEEAMKDFATSYNVGKVARRYFYKLHYIQ